MDGVPVAVGELVEVCIVLETEVGVRFLFVERGDFLEMRVVLLEGLVIGRLSVQAV